MRKFKLQNVDIEYHINKEKQVVIAICKSRMLEYNAVCKSYVAISYFTTVGMASPKKEDKFNVETGKKVARAIAEKRAYEVLRAKAKKYLKELQQDAEQTLEVLNSTTALIQHQKEYISKF